MPVELLLDIISRIHDRCFAWFVLRSVSRLLRRLTEDVFANRIIYKRCSIRLAGDYARSIL